MPVLTAGTALRYDWTVEQGEFVQLRIPVLDSASAPFTVTGWSVDAKVKHQPGGDVLHTWAPGDITVSGTDVTLAVLPATSLAWMFERGWWRCKIIHPSDATQIHRIVEGVFRVSRD